MTDQVLPLHASVHRKVDELLPFYVNDTLEGEERALVARHLEECAQCRGEVDWLRSLHAACGALAEQDDGSEGLALPRHTRKRGWLASPAWRYAAAAQLAVIAVLGWKLWTVDDGAAQYRTLSSAGGITTGNAVVVFDAAAPEAAMRELLQSAGARIVGGPTATHGYVLALPADSRDQAVERLRAARIVKLAEPLGNGATP